jgi:hypothetical protein
MMRSTDKGATWSAPEVVHKIQFEGAFDPDTGLPIRAEGFVPEVAVDRSNGNLYATWQDIRFSGVDQIALSMSTNGGNTWSEPIKVSQTPASADPANEQAWVPAVHVSDDGTLAVTYYDFRFNTPAPGVPTDHWMVHCHPAGTTTCAEADDWGYELRLTDTSFDVEQLPFARGRFGYFVGEYEGLSSTGKHLLATVRHRHRKQVDRHRDRNGRPVATGDRVRTRPPPHRGGRVHSLAQAKSLNTITEALPIIWSSTAGCEKPDGLP